MRILVELVSQDEPGAPWEFCFHELMCCNFRRSCCCGGFTLLSACEEEEKMCSAHEDPPEEERVSNQNLLKMFGKG